MSSTPAHTTPPDEHISLLDLIVVVAERWKLLLLGSLAVGLIAFGVASIQPREYSASISLAVAPDALAPYLTSEGLNAIAVAKGVSPSLLENGLSVRPVDPADPSRGTVVQVQLGSAGTATGLLERLAGNLAQAIEDERIELPFDRIHAELTEVQESIAFYRRAMTELSQELGEDGLPVGERIAMANVMSQAMEVLGDLEMTEIELTQMQSNLSAQLIIAGPTEPRPANSISPTLTAVLAALSVGLLLLIWIFVSEGLRRSSSLPGGAEKLRRIRHALAFRRKKA